MWNFFTGQPTQDDIREAESVSSWMNWWNDAIERRKKMGDLPFTDIDWPTKVDPHVVHTPPPPVPTDCPTGYWKASDGSCLIFKRRDASGLGATEEGSISVGQTVLYAGILIGGIWFLSKG